ncbi:MULTISPECIES: ACP S-malonyltransferase [Fusobacterium]|uniref:ACP S-malonyltransferase n=1 Tax=Fusobacterium TaxID=848 RepID=UPI001F37B358|nr:MULTISPECIES: ACP S-malonyltransferase [Fusobacterium]MCF2612080.1 ACP S-malonyltransferase [Fusobacterium perfoetens]MDY2981384.1 ACP S-malonyltransferase [Fusobacterium sp.]
MSKIAFVFPGQGTQFVGMGKDIYENSEIAKKEFDEIFGSLSFDLKDAMFNGPEETLKKTKYTQPAIVAMSLVLEKLVRAKGITPDFVAGHSVGEYAAMGSAGFLTLSEAVKLTSFRGEVMNEIAEQVNGGMAAIIGMESSDIIEALKEVDGVVEAVNFNEPKQTVIAGDKQAIEKACEVLKAKGARRAMPLAVSGPFHSSLMKPAGEKLREEAEKYNFKDAEVTLVANTTADFLTKPEEIKAEIYAQSFGPVKWVDTIKKLKENGVDTIYEIGPGKVLAGLIKKIDKEIKVVNINSVEDVNNL